LRRFVFALITILLLIGIVSTTSMYEDWLWFKDLGYSQLFWTPLLTKITVQAVNGIFLFIAIFATLLMLRKSLVILINDRFQRQIRVIREHDFAPVAETLDSRIVTIAMFFISILFSYGISFVSGNMGWMDYLSYSHSTPFNITDPVFGADLSLYFFKLPFYRILYNSFYIPLLFLSIISLVLYLLTGMVSIRSLSIWRTGTVRMQRPARLHLAAIGTVLFILKAFSYWMSHYELVYSRHGHVFGAGFTDILVNVPMLNILLVLSVLGALGTALSLFFKDIRLLTAPVCALILISIVGGGLLPTAVQSLIVVPNELTKELPYINHEINSTKYAFGLDKIKEVEYPGVTPIDQTSLNNNKTTIENIRLNDPRPMAQTYAQKQGIRLYYKFNDIDIDRYTLDGKLRQVMLTPRELSSEDIDPKAKTFVNLKFKYTHGYGVAASLANAVTPEGLPTYVVKDIPPVSTYPELNITEPRVYFGELTNDWVVTNTTAKEFDYPQGSNNAEVTYKGTTGIKLTALNKLMLSIKHGTFRFYLANEITPESKILLNRNVLDRVKKLAPFLDYDKDPYLVISGGKLYWIIDAYTTSENMPYSSPLKDSNVNYMRNSVKAVVDAYNGSVDFYLTDKTDPVAQTYNNIFPTLLKDLSQMPADLRSHIRYPQDLFSSQMNVLKTFHMSNPGVFYNKEDAWDIASELYGTKPQPVEPYYTVMRLPGEPKEEYVLMIPFTPASSETNKRNNMVAWLGARMDGDKFGELILYKLPKNIEVDGPFQIESRIDQDTEISRQLSLWNQKGSEVIRGNTLTLPIDGNFLYIEPVYLQSVKGGIPEMKRVVAVYADKIVMAENLDLALEGIFGKGAPTPTTPVVPPTPGTQPPVPAQSEQVQKLLEQVDQLKKLIEGMETQIKGIQGAPEQKPQ
jgi:uncharacterized protein